MPQLQDFASTEIIVGIIYGDIIGDLMISNDIISHIPLYHHNGDFTIGIVYHRDLMISNGFPLMMI